MRSATFNKMGIDFEIPVPDLGCLVLGTSIYQLVAHRAAKPGETVYSIVEGRVKQKPAGTTTAYWIVNEVREPSLDQVNKPEDDSTRPFYPAEFRVPVDGDFIWNETDGKVQQVAGIVEVFDGRLWIIKLAPEMPSREVLQLRGEQYRVTKFRKVSRGEMVYKDECGDEHVSLGVHACLTDGDYAWAVEPLPYESAPKKSVRHPVKAAKKPRKVVKKPSKKVSKPKVEKKRVAKKPLKKTRKVKKS